MSKWRRQAHGGGVAARDELEHFAMTDVRCPTIDPSLLAHCPVRLATGVLEHQLECLRDLIQNLDARAPRWVIEADLNALKAFAEVALMTRNAREELLLEHNSVTVDVFMGVVEHNSR